MEISLKRLGTLLMFSVLLISFISATTPLQELMSNQATGITITMTQDTTTEAFYLNTAGLSFDSQTLSSGSESITFPISGLLNGINLNVDLNDGATYPVFSNVVISSSPISIVYNDVPMTLNNGLVGVFNLFNSDNMTDFSITGETVHDTQVLNDLAQANPSPIPMQGNSDFVKNGNTYTFSHTGGFGDVPSEYKNLIGEAIQKGVNSMNLNSMIQDNVLPLVNFEDVFPVAQELGYSISEVDFENAVALVLNNTNYNVSVDLTSVAFQDGTYQIPVIIIPLSGDTTPITKTVTLVLNGIINEANEDSNSNGTYIPTDFGVAEVISSIQGLQPNTVLAVNVQDVKPAEVTLLTNFKVLKYLIINVNQQPVSNSLIFFTIDKSKITDPDKVVLYRWETATNSWAALSTTHLTNNDTATDYAFQAVTSHFSTFMIGEDITQTPSEEDTSSSRRSRSSSSSSSSSIVSTTGEVPSAGVLPPVTPTANPDNSAPITGGILGAIVRNGGFIALTFVVLLGGVVLLVQLRKRKMKLKVQQ